MTPCSLAILAVVFNLADSIMKCFFITGHNRSGTNLISKLLNGATNARVFEELSPKLGYEAREKHKGHFPSRDTVKKFIEVQKKPHIELVNEMGLVFGDKNSNYIPFLTEIAEVWPDAKFVIAVRDGRDVVTSHCNYFANTGKKVFQMAEDVGDSGDQYPVANLWDYSRLRPREGEARYSDWQDMSLFAKCCFSWAYTNDILFSALATINESRWFVIDVSNISTQVVRAAFDFLGLEGFSAQSVSALINSQENKTKIKRQVSWAEWSAEERKMYEEYCQLVHEKLYGPINWEVQGI
jgi:hypothetical protein